MSVSAGNAEPSLRTPPEPERHRGRQLLNQVPVVRRELLLVILVDAQLQEVRRVLELGHGEPEQVREVLVARPLVEPDVDAVGARCQYRLEVLGEPWDRLLVGYRLHTLPFPMPSAGVSILASGRSDGRRGERPRPGPFSFPREGGWRGGHEDRRARPDRSADACLGSSGTRRRRVASRSRRRCRPRASSGTPDGRTRAPAPRCARAGEDGPVGCPWSRSTFDAAERGVRSGRTGPG